VEQRMWEGREREMRLLPIEISGYAAVAKF